MRDRPEYPDALGYGLRARTEIIVDPVPDVSPGVYSGERARVHAQVYVQGPLPGRPDPGVVAYASLHSRSDIGRIVARHSLTSHELMAIDEYLRLEVAPRLPYPDGGE